MARVFQARTAISSSIPVPQQVQVGPAGRWAGWTAISAEGSDLISVPYTAIREVDFAASTGMLRLDEIGRLGASAPC